MSIFKRRSSKSEAGGKGRGSWQGDTSHQLSLIPPFMYETEAYRWRDEAQPADHYVCLSCMTNACAAQQHYLASAQWEEGTAGGRLWPITTMEQAGGNW